MSDEQVGVLHSQCLTHVLYIPLPAMKRKPPGQDTAGQPTAAVINRPPVSVHKGSDVHNNKKQPQKSKAAAAGKPKKLTKADIGLPTDFRLAVVEVW